MVSEVGTVLESAGPLSHEEYESIPASAFTFTPDDAEWIQEHESEFRIYEKQ